MNSLALAPAERAMSVVTSDGLELFVRHMKGKPRAAGEERILIITHGIGEHGGRYAHLPSYLGDEFSDFYAMDLRGHGRSPGIRGYSPSFDQFVDDVVALIQRVRQTHKKKPEIYLLGHSMGGLITLRLLQREKNLGLAGGIISAPFLGLSMKVPLWKVKLGRILVKTLGKFQLNNEINPSHLSHDPKIIEAYVNDRLNHSKITPRMYFDLMDALVLVGTATEALCCPTLFLIPGDDRLVDSKVALSFYEALKDRDKAIREYPEMYHEVLNETDKEKVFADIKAWIKKV